MRTDSVLCVALVAVACTQPRPATHAPAPAPAKTAQPEPEPLADLSPEASDTCIAAASQELFVPFISPGGSRDFRQHMARRVRDLRCCFTPERNEELAGERLVVNFVPNSHDPRDGASTEIDEPVSTGRPNEEACVYGVTVYWRMDHAPVSDVIRMDRRGRSFSESAGVTLSWPL